MNTRARALSIPHRLPGVVSQAPGRISDVDRERVRDANRIEAVIGDYVALKRAGGGNLKGLCPFHDEKTPSFNVSVARGFYHCFGCGAGGDVFEFLMQIDQLTFVEAVQQLAERAGLTLTMAAPRAGEGHRTSRSQLTAITAATAEFYAQQLLTDEAATARTYLTERGFDKEAAEHFGCGFAPGGWDTLLQHLLKRGFSVDHMLEAGVVRRGQRGPIDQFHRRLTWAIRDAAGDVVGFGARRIFDDDRLPAKYVNTSGEGRLYRKSQVLFGLDLAKRDVVKTRQAVVVEGYTDVMAMHLAGVTTAVATCGTAFGDGHISMLRRYLMDEDRLEGEVIYVFDGDEAGQAAAAKAFDSDQRFAAHTYVAIAPDGMDPCELRQQHGDAALRTLIDSRQPLFRFAITQVLHQYDLDAVEGRTSALSATAPLAAKIKDPIIRAGYERELALWLGVDERTVAQAVRRAKRQGDRSGGATRPGREQRTAARPVAAAAAEAEAGQTAPVPQQFRRPRRDPQAATEREALKLAVQCPAVVEGDYALISEREFTDPTYAAVYSAVMAAGGPTANAGPEWAHRIQEHLPQGPLRSLVTELTVEPLRSTADEPEPRYAGAIIASMAERGAAAQERELMSALQRAESGGDRDRAAALLRDLSEVAHYRRALADRARGADSL